MAHDKTKVRKILDDVKASGRTSLTANRPLGILAVGLEHTAPLHAAHRGCRVLISFRNQRNDRFSREQERRN